MKSKSKALLLVVCAVLLVVASVLGTLAYLTAQDSVTNTFTVGNVALSLDEVDYDNSSEGERDQANEYHLLPGHEYEKDPTIHVAEKSEDCYLFVKVENGIEGIEDEEATIADQMADNGWIPVDGVANVYVLAKDGKPVEVSEGENVVVFESFKIAGTVDNETLAAYEEASVNVTAYAVQMDGFEDNTAAEIWADTFGA